MRFARLVPSIILIWLAAVAPGHAEKRVALVIGNSAYREAPKLANPANDAEAVSILLKNAGFEVVQTRGDLGINDMRRAVRDFSDQANDADIAVVFYAGHGIEVDGINYLVPVDAKLERDLDVEDETVSLDRVLKVIEPAKRLRLVIVDACRENPFVKTIKRTLASRAIGRGLARVEPVTSDTLIAFAAKAGSTAADGDGTHSPFTGALIKHLATPGLDVRIAFGRIRDEVLRMTRKRQEPFVYGSLGGSNVALVSPTKGEPSDTPPSDQNTQVASQYELAAKVNTKEAWDAFLATHPTGFYAELARAQRAKAVAALSVERPIAPGSEKKQNKPVQGQQPEKKNAKSTGITVTADWCAQYMPNGVDPGIYRAGMANPVGRASWSAIARSCGLRR